MDKKLQGKVAIVTGGASGIGEATARLFAAQGARAVIIADIMDEKGHSVAKSIGADSCRFFHCDVADENQVESLVNWTAYAYGGLDIMFSNAGIIGCPSNSQSILNLDLAVFDQVMRVNARGSAACVKHAARKMIELGVRGTIVCTASVAVECTAPGKVDYAMSKCAVVGLMRSAFQKLGEHGIRINCVSPSAIPTPLSSSIAESIEKRIGPATSLKGVALTVEHVAESVVFLASDAAAFVTGQNLVVDGGLNIWHSFEV